MLLRWNPEIALDDDEERFIALKQENKMGDFISTIRGLISSPYYKTPKNLSARRRQKICSFIKLSPKKQREVNKQVYKRQLLLEERNQNKQFLLIKKILAEEISSV